MINNKIWGLVGLAARARKICFWSRQCRTRNEKEKSQISTNSTRQLRKKKKTKFQKLCKEKNQTECFNRGHRNIGKSIGKVNKAIIE